MAVTVLGDLTARHCRAVVEQAVDEFGRDGLLVNKRGVAEVAAIVDVGHNTDPAG